MSFVLHLPGDRWAPLRPPVSVPCSTCPGRPWAVEVGAVGDRRLVRLTGGALLGRQVATLRPDGPDLTGYDVFAASRRIVRPGVSLPPTAECSALALALNEARGLLKK